METGGESLFITPQERIRQSALGLLLDAEHGVGGIGPDDQLSRLSHFVAIQETDLDQEALSLAEIHNGSDGLEVKVTWFKKEPSSQKDDYVVTGFASIKFPDPFESKQSKDNGIPEEELKRIAEVLEDPNIVEAEISGLSTLLVLRLKLESIYHGIDNRLIRVQGLVEQLSPKERKSRVRDIATKLRRVLKF